MADGVRDLFDLYLPLQLNADLVIGQLGQEPRWADRHRERAFPLRHRTGR